MTVDEIIEGLIGREGRYSNNPADKGGETMWGITATTARRNGYKGQMKDLPRQTAKAIYLSEYFLAPKFNLVYDVCPAIAEELLDTAVNCGVGFASPLIQQALNLLNREQQDYKDIVEDGKIGPNTVNALKLYLAKRGKEGQDVLLKLLNILQGYRYVEITKSRPKNEQFLYGWIRTRIGL